MIPQDFIQTLLGRVDIVDVIDRHVRLKKAGGNYKACCPFHNEKTPSFNVSPSKQFYHCLGGGAHGNAIGFLMEYSGLTYPDAVRELAQQVGLEVPQTRSPGPGRPAAAAAKSLTDRMMEALTFYPRAIRWIVGKCPDQLRLPFALWTREAVQQLLRDKFGLEVSVWTVGRYLKAWGLTPQKPVRRAFEQNPAEVRHWLQTEYPAIEREAKRLRAEIHWGDEMGLRSDHQVGPSYGRRGKTPVIPGTVQRFRCNMISTITNRGRLAFMVFEEGFTVKVFLRFLKRLARHVNQQLFLIVDRHPVHRAAGVARWLRQHGANIRMFFLPSYSPELNPDEMLNQDVKSNALGRRRPWDKVEMMGDVRGYLRSTQRQPNLVMSYFLESHVHYAA